MSTNPQNGDGFPAPDQLGRGRPLPLWMVLLLALLIHGVVVLATSFKTILGGPDLTPEGRMLQARQLLDEEEYQPALALLEQIVQEKPKPPAVFIEAEEMLPRVRLQAVKKEERLRKEREAEEEEQEKEAEGEGEGPEEGETPGDGGSTGGPPDIELPTLPDID